MSSGLFWKDTFALCYGLNAFVLSQIHMLKPNPQGDNIWYWDFGRLLRLHEVMRMGLLCGISALMKRDTRASLVAQWLRPK